MIIVSTTKFFDTFDSPIFLCSLPRLEHGSTQMLLSSQRHRSWSPPKACPALNSSKKVNSWTQSMFTDIREKSSMSYLRRWASTATSRCPGKRSTLKRTLITCWTTGLPILRLFKLPKSDKPSNKLLRLKPQRPRLPSSSKSSDYW